MSSLQNFRTLSRRDFAVMGKSPKPRMRIIHSLFSVRYIVYEFFSVDRYGRVKGAICAYHDRFAPCTNLPSRSSARYA